MRRYYPIAFAFALMLLSPVGVLAQEESAPESRAQSFQAVEGATKEDVPGGPLLLGAYALIWILVFAYLLRLGRTLGRLEAQFRTLGTSRTDSSPTTAASSNAQQS